MNSVVLAVGASVGASVEAAHFLYFWPTSLAQTHPAFFLHLVAPVISEQKTLGGVSAAAAAGVGLVQVLCFAAGLARLNSHPEFTHCLDFWPYCAQFCALHIRSGGGH